MIVSTGFNITITLVSPQFLSPAYFSLQTPRFTFKKDYMNGPNSNHLLSIWMDIRPQYVPNITFYFLPNKTTPSACPAQPICLHRSKGHHHPPYSIESSLSLLLYIQFLTRNVQQILSLKYTLSPSNSLKLPKQPPLPLVYILRNPPNWSSSFHSCSPLSVYSHQQNSFKWISDLVALEEKKKEKKSLLDLHCSPNEIQTPY